MITREDLDRLAGTSEKLIAGMYQQFADAAERICEAEELLIEGRPDMARTRLRDLRTEIEEFVAAEAYRRN